MHVFIIEICVNTPKLAIKAVCTAHKYSLIDPQLEDTLSRVIVELGKFDFKFCLLRCVTFTFFILRKFCGVCAYCEEEFTSKKKLTSHILLCGSQYVIVRKFNSRKEMDKWIEEMQLETNSFYSAQTGAKVHNNTKYYYIYCQHLARLQSAKAQKKRKTCIKRKSGLVPNHSCPSKIVVHHEQGGPFKLKFYSLHNHACKVEYLKFQRYPKSFRGILIAKLEMEIDQRRVLYDERSPKWNGPERHDDGLRINKKDLLDSR